MTDLRPGLTVRQRGLVLLLWAPTLLVAGAMAASGVWRAVRADAVTSVAYDQTAFIDALALNDARTGSRFIWTGTDPNAVVPVKHPVLTGGRVMFVSPLAWAVASGAPRSALMLLGLGADLHRPDNRMTVCLARRLGYAETEAMLRADSTRPLPTECPAADPAEPPLAAFEVK